MEPPGWSFDNSYARLPEMLFTRLSPAPSPDPRLVILNAGLARELGLDFSSMDAHRCARILAGDLLPEGAAPLAQAYAGHQFGHFTMLGDGRAIVLGEQITPDGRRFDIQFKGSGRTPYSRNGDGKAVLGPMLREYIISEALHALGIPTTRSLAVVTTGETVFREQMEPGAILTRVAASHLRVGTFQYLAMRQETGVMRQLVDHALARHYPERAGAENPALALLEGVLDRQAALVVDWMRVGFIHGVMNTDNMTVSGETIDYGPCAFMDAYHPETVFSSIDHGGRYAYGNQPRMAQWNGARFAEALLPLLDDDPDSAAALAQEAIDGFGPLLQARWLEMMRGKLGLAGAEAGDAGLVGDLLAWMTRRAADHTVTFRTLAADATPDGPLFREPEFQGWQRRWLERLARNPDGHTAARTRMRRANPAVIPRNHQVEQALHAATREGDLRPVHALLAALATPCADRPDLAPYQSPPDPSAPPCQTFCGT